MRDELIALPGTGAAERCPSSLRRAEVEDPDAGGTLVFLTKQQFMAWGQSSP